MLIGDILARSARAAPGAPALIDGDARMTYGEFDAACTRLAQGLVAAGFARGMRLGAMMTNRLEYALLFFAAARAGLVLANLSTRSGGRDLASMIGTAGIRALAIQHDLLPRLAEALEQGVAAPEAIVVGGPDGDGLAALAARGAAGGAALPALDPDDLLSLNFTGGTTGRPKAVAVTHRARVASIEAGRALLGLAPQDVSVVATPMFHTVGLHVWFGATIGAGACAVPLAGWDAERFMRLAERHRATAALFVPTQISDVLRSPGFLPERLATLRKIHFAGAPMHGPLLDRLQAELPWAVPVEHYGQSETGPIALRPPEWNAAKRGTVGRAVAGVEICVVDREGRALPPGAIGEVLTRGPNLLREYWDDPEQTSEAFRFGDGWLATGDMGFLDADGFLTLVDRAKDMIVSGGENIYPVELETALLRHPAVVECAVFGIPDDHWGEVPVAHVVLRPGASASAQELIALAERETARWKRPRVVEFVAALPRTPVGKIQKNLLREPYWSHRDRRI
jgi:acyl-CoA synthetase (AMP-forming)/AMP-acid ligase II